ncbi:MAG TPA: hypothetical protein PLU35_08235 [Phycisphaerales bacterium]|nr:hypothetical protein [Phycisphaerales bacterium]
MSERQDVKDALKALLNAIADALESDAELREAGRRVAGLLFGPTPAAPPPAAPPRDVRAPEPKPVVQVVQPKEPIRGPKQVLEFRIGDSNPVETVLQGSTVHAVRPIDRPEPAPVVAAPPPARGAPATTADLPDLELVRRSASLKAHACAAPPGAAADRLMAQIDRVRDSGATPADLWMFDPKRRDPEGLALGVTAYEALAVAAELGRALDKAGRIRPGGDLERHFALMAQAQSAVRRFVDEFRGEVDTDQLAMFRWLRTLTSEDRCGVLVERYMRRDDVADPAESAGVKAALQAELAALESSLKVQKILDNLAYKAERLAADPQPDPDEVRRMDELVREAVALGVRTNEGRLTRALSPAAGVLDAGESASPEFAEAVAHARARAGSSAQKDDSEADARLEPIVAEAAALLRTRGVRRMAIAGGLDYPAQRQRLERDFDLEDVVRVEAQADKSNADLGSRIAAARPGLVLVTRWLSHSQTDAVVESCRSRGLPCVRLPYESGLGSVRVASAIIEQFGPVEAR